MVPASTNWTYRANAPQSNYFIKRKSARLMNDHWWWCIAIRTLTDHIFHIAERSIPMEAQIPATDVCQGLAWAFVLNYLVPTLPGKFQRAVYLWRLKYRQMMSTKVWPGPLCWTSQFLLCLVSFREQYTYGGSDTGNWRLSRSGLGLCVELPGSYSAW